MYGQQVAISKLANENWTKSKYFTAKSDQRFCIYSVLYGHKSTGFHRKIRCFSSSLRYEGLGISLFLPKAKVHFTVLIDLNVHGLDVAGIELVLFTGGHVSPGHFVDLSEDLPDVEVHLFL